MSISFISIHQVPHLAQAQAIPSAFCWTRFGTEAGESIEEIVDRKEQERQHNEGVFFWGIGNSVAPGMSALLAMSDRPTVLFSPIRGKPRAVDRSPAARFVWTAGLDLNGERFELPPMARVTSGGSPGGSGRPHYALVCSSPSPLSIGADDAEVDFLALRNLVSGNPLGVSQVTAVVRSIEGQARSDMRYRVAMQAELAPPYFVRLTEVVAEPFVAASVS